MSVLPRSRPPQRRRNSLTSKTQFPDRPWTPVENKNSADRAWLAAQSGHVVVAAEQENANDSVCGGQLDNLGSDQQILLDLQFIWRADHRKDLVLIFAIRSYGEVAPAEFLNRPYVGRFGCQFSLLPPCQTNPVRPYFEIRSDCVKSFLRTVKPKHWAICFSYCHARNTMALLWSTNPALS